MKKCITTLLSLALLPGIPVQSAEAPLQPLQPKTESYATYLGVLPHELQDEIVHYLLYPGEVLNILVLAKKIIALGHLLSAEKLLKILNALPTNAAALYLAQELKDFPGIQNKMIQDWLANAQAILRYNQALQDAVMRGNTELIKQLLQDKNIDLNGRSTDGGQTALLYAYNYGQLHLIPMLLNAGANPNMPDTYGETVLMKAARENHAEVVTMLLAAGANPHLKDKYDRTALAIATLSRNSDICALLLKAGADPFLKNKFGESPYDLARKTNKKEIVKLFDQWAAEQKAK